MALEVYVGVNWVLDFLFVVYLGSGVGGGFESGLGINF